MSRNNLTESEALSRVSAQMPLAKKVKLADVVVDNNGTVDELKARVTDLCQALLQQG